jgi:hypothetical protein
MSARALRALQTMIAAGEALRAADVCLFIFDCVDERFNLFGLCVNLIYNEILKNSIFFVIKALLHVCGSFIKLKYI